MHTFSAAELLVLTGPGTYMYKIGEDVLYVGASKDGLGRCLNGQHRMAELFKSGKVNLVFMPATSIGEAFALETALIEKHKPVYNRDQKDAYRRYRLKSRSLKHKRKPQAFLTKEIVEKLRQCDYGQFGT